MNIIECETEMNIKKYTIRINKDTYFIYVSKDGNVIRFYINKENYSIIEFMIDFNINDIYFNIENIENFIKQNIEIWTKCYTHTIKKMEV